MNMENNQDNQRPVSSVPVKQGNSSDSSDWLNAYYDPIARLNTHTNAVELTDVFGDGDTKFIVANYGTSKADLKLKVFKGPSILKESNLVDTPTAILSLYMDNLQPRVPGIAVASGSALYVYKNLRPGFQFTLPGLSVADVEKEIWAKAKDDKIDIQTMFNTLEDIRRGGQIKLSATSLVMLNLPMEEVRRYVDTYKHAELKTQVVITCLAKINKNSSDEDAINCIVVGTEQKTIYILESEAFTILTTMECPHVPTFINASGLYDVEYRIIVGCRDGVVYTYKRGFKTPKTTISLSSQVVGLEKSGKNVVIGCMDQCLYCYTTKGKRMWKIELPSCILTMGSMELKTTGIQAVIVAMENRQVHIYRDKYLISRLDTEDAVTSVKFGKFGREEGNLVMTTRNGGLIVRILKRNATLQNKDPHGGPPEAQSKKLDIPKKTKLYVDQTTRERDNAIAMHQVFQQELYRFRIKTAKAFLKSLQTSSTPVSTNPNEPLKLNAQVQGIGPTFKLILKVQNISSNSPSFNLYLMFMYDESLYKMTKSYIELPMLVPGLEYPFCTYVQSISNQLISDNIKVLLCKKQSSVPIITAVLSMPVSETEIIS